MLVWVSVDARGMLVPAWMLPARSRRPAPDLTPLPLRSQQAGLLALHLLHLTLQMYPLPSTARNVAAKSAVTVLAAIASLRAAGRIPS